MDGADMALSSAWALKKGSSVEQSSARTRAAAGFRVAAFFAFVAPIAAATAISYLPAKKYEGTAWMILDASRGPQSVAGPENRWSGNEVVTYDQLLRTQLAIAGSDDVVLKAVHDLRPVRLYPNVPVAGRTDQELDRAEAAIARNNMVLGLEPNTFIFKLSFRHKDPVIAARFANLLGQEFLARRSALYSNAGDADFFKTQEARLTGDLRAAATALADYERQNSIYSVPEQRRLLLERRAAAAKDASDNAVQSARLESETNSIKAQMLTLRGKMTLPSEIFGEKASTLAAARNRKGDDFLAGDPPLLNVKIYEDSAARLVAANAELAGLEATKAERALILAQIDAELQALAAREATDSRLQSSVKQAESAIDDLSRRAGEAQINNAWRSNESFSSAQILQVATVPNAPVFPQPLLFIPAGVVAGVFLSLLILFTGRRLGARSFDVVRNIIPDELSEDQGVSARAWRSYRATLVQ